MNLSANFTLAEMQHSQAAARAGKDNTAPPWAVGELTRLAKLILQPLRDRLGRPVVVSSGWRSPAVNALVGGSRNSDHMQGRAADITVPGMTPLEVAHTIREMQLPYQQLIHEFREWVHVSIPPDGSPPRRELLTAIAGPRGTVYERGLV
ncbi:MAG: D-Ala-D-Ala carboxypeptidase family metallohydrolase [Tagaea sp.]